MGLTSHDVVQRVRRVLGTRAAGHTGTLDPFATGLLVVLVGRATRLARFIEAEAKTYLATARLGVATDTDDRTGVPSGEPADLSSLTVERVEKTLAGFVGDQLQRPPRYSAKHVDGQRSYRLARRGAGVDPPAVRVTVHRVELVTVTIPIEGPVDVTFRATVGAGTYLRAIARDLGERLGVGAHLTALRRESIGALRVEDAVALAEISADALLAPRRVLAHLPTLELDAPARQAVSHGRALPGIQGARGHLVLVQGEELVAVARAEEGCIRPSVVLGTP